MSRNIAIDEKTGGFVFAGGVLQFVDKKASIVQGVRCALKTMAGEYFLDDANDPQVGVPYFQKVLVKNPDPRVLDAVFRKAILGVLGVTAVVSMDFNFKRDTRELDVAWQAESDEGLVSDSSAVGL